MLRAEVDGLSIAYQRAGDGPPLVLLHGFTHDSRAWRPQLARLADQFTVIAWDAPGAGQSVDPPETFGISDWADCLAGFLAAVGIRRGHIVGLSWVRRSIGPASLDRPASTTRPPSRCRVIAAN